MDNQESSRDRRRLSESSLKTPQEHRLLELHACVLSGDQVALNVVAQQLLHVLPPYLRRAFRRAAPDLITDAVEDAIIEYASGPHRFDPSRGVPLERFLYLAAVRNLQDRLRGEARRQERERRYAGETAVLDERKAQRYPAERIPALRSLVQAICNQGEREAAVAWIQGERKTSALAVHLRLSLRPVADQQRAVKQFKDRMLKRLARLSEARST